MMAQIAPTAWMLVPLAGWLAAGIAVGAIYFRTVRRSADLLVSGGSVGIAVLLVVARMAVLAAALYMAAITGTLPLLAAAGGVLIGRGIVLRQSTGTA